jgi:hypothetical protein
VQVLILNELVQDGFASAPNLAVQAAKHVPFVLLLGRPKKEKREQAPALHMEFYTKISVSEDSEKSRAILENCLVNIPLATATGAHGIVAEFGVCATCPGLARIL